MSVVEFPRPPGITVDEMLVGPFEEYRVIVEGRFIPHLTAVREGGDTSLIVDHRFSISVPNERFHDVAWLVANAMAVACGYAWLGAETKDRVFAPLATKLDNAP